MPTNDLVPSTYSSLITLNTHSNASSLINQTNDLTHLQNKRYSTNKSSKKISNHMVIVPKSKSYRHIDKHHHSSCPVAYQNQITLGTITVLSDSGSDNTILNHLPEHNETTDKSQQSLHDERLHRSPRKSNKYIIESHFYSTSSVDEQKKLSIPSIIYTIEPSEIIDNLNDDNDFDLKQKAIREENKRKANENEQILINVDEYAPEILMHLRKREVELF